MTREEAHHGSASAVVPVFFLSDSTGISAETMSNALLILFQRHGLPVVDSSTKSVEEISTIILQRLKTMNSLPTPSPVPPHVPAPPRSTPRSRP